MKAPSLTDEQVIELVNEYMKARPNATRSQVLTKAAPVGEKRIKTLEAAGLIKLPKPMTRVQSSHTWLVGINRNIKERTA